MDVLQVKNLSFTYPGADTPALNGLDFSVRQGEFVLLCGASGCGKTTLLSLIKPSLAPVGKRSGEILYNGNDVSEASDGAAEIGFVRQDPELGIVTDKVWHELAFGLENSGTDPAVIGRKVAETASFFGIAPWYEKDTASLSGGQKQILNLASLLVTDPKILLLDEPTANLDPIASSEFLSLLKRIHLELGITIILSEHRLEEVFPIADRVMLLEKGSVLSFTSPGGYAKEIRKVRREFSLYPGLPAAMRVFAETGGEGDCPVSIREGKRYLEDRFQKRDLPATDENKASKPESVLSVRELYFRYEKRSDDVLKGLDLDLPRGKFSCLLGGNGTGKSTLLRILCGLEKAYHGSVKLDGKPVRSLKEKTGSQGGIAFLPQDPKACFLKNTLREDLSFYLNTRGLAPDRIEEKIKEVSEKMEIAPLLDRHPLDLSGGETERCAIAKLLLSDPAVLLLDEPTKGMDASFKIRFAAILKECCESGKTVFMATHDLEFAAEYSDHAGILFGGRIVSFLPSREFFRGNRFYTTAFHRMASSLFPSVVTKEDLVECCKKSEAAK